MRTLKRTKEADRITADLEVHKNLMDDHVVSGKTEKDASRQALIDLQNIPVADRIRRANEMRRTQ